MLFTLFSKDACAMHVVEAISRAQKIFANSLCSVLSVGSLALCLSSVFDTHTHGKRFKFVTEFDLSAESLSLKGTVCRFVPVAGQLAITTLPVAALYAFSSCC